MVEVKLLEITGKDHHFFTKEDFSNAVSVYLDELNNLFRSYDSIRVSKHGVFLNVCITKPRPVQHGLNGGERKTKIMSPKVVVRINKASKINAFKKLCHSKFEEKMIEEVTDNCIECDGADLGRAVVSTFSDVFGMLKRAETNVELRGHFSCITEKRTNMVKRRNPATGETLETKASDKVQFKYNKKKQEELTRRWV